ncbi:MAG: hypothetical protein KIT72_11155 [Polyangiaceae bacterium]|nr:hypothetical protein [Polyangiaceae bacterium]MCW5790969.1 hypothetical protein [Polyangiaceae bacterium]
MTWNANASKPGLSRLRLSGLRRGVSLVGWAMAAGLMCSAVTAPASAQAKGKAPAKAAAKAPAKGAKEDGKEAKKPPPKPGEIVGEVRLSPAGLKWGLSNEQIAKIYDKVFEAEFVPLYKRVQPGPRMAALDAELEAKKARLRRSVIQFDDTATGIDETPLAHEYTYRNGESMSRISLRTGTMRHFFFFNNKLWKIYDERPLTKGGRFGPDFKTAVERLTKTMGAPPIVLEPDRDMGRSFTEAIWMNDAIIVRLIDREFQGKVGLVYVSKDVQSNIGSYRKNKKPDPSKLSKDIEHVTRKAPEPEPEPKSKPKGGK